MKALSSLPMVNIQPYLNNLQPRHLLAQQIRQICKDIGFFCVENHGVPIKLQKSMLANTQKFFNLPKQQKIKIHMSKRGIRWRGYFQVGQEYTSGKIDLKEGLYLGQQYEDNHPRVINKTPLHGKNQYPEELPELKADIQEWLGHMSILGDSLMQAIAESLHLDRYFFRNTMCKQHTGLFRLFHYPAAVNQDPSLLGVGEHTDYGLITMLMISDKGLQVKDRQDNWIDVDPIPNTFVINIGDILEKMTKGLYKSTPHKVRNTQGKSRYSMPYFYDPGWEAQLKELSIEVSESQAELQRATFQYKRWDNMHMEQLKGTYDRYLISKVSKIFPELAKQL